jgi:hypothetical protein
MQAKLFNQKCQKHNPHIMTFKNGAFREKERESRMEAISEVLQNILILTVAKTL